MNFTNQATEQYKRYTPEQKSYLGLGLTLGLLILLVALIYPAIQHILNLRKEITSGTVVLKKLETKANALNLAEQNFESVKEHLTTLDASLPTGSNVKDYIKRPLESLAKENKLKVTGLQFNEVPLSVPMPEELTKVNDLEYSFSLSGKFDDFNSFLDQIERFIRTTEITSIALVSVKNRSVTANIKAVTYYFGEGSTKGTAKTKGGK